LIKNKYIEKDHMGKIVRTGYGAKSGDRKGYKQGGRGANRTSNCRHPSIKKGRK